MAHRAPAPFALLALYALYALLALQACSSADGDGQPAVVFRIQSPYCGPNTYAFRFSIDSQVVGNELLRDTQASPRYSSTTGPHHLTATVTTGVFSGFTRDTLVTLAPETIFTWIVDLYCS